MPATPPDGLMTALFVHVSFGPVKSVTRDVNQWSQDYKNYWKLYIKAPQEQEASTKAEKWLKHMETFSPLFLRNEAKVTAADLQISTDTTRLESSYVWAQ